MYSTRKTLVVALLASSCAAFRSSPSLAGDPDVPIPLALLMAPFTILKAVFVGPEAGGSGGGTIGSGKSLRLKTVRHRKKLEAGPSDGGGDRRHTEK
jgi:hypothetical protein